MTSVTSFSQPGDSANPSPSIWGDCPNTLLNDLALGHFIHEDFRGPPTGTLAAALDVSMISIGGNIALSADTDTVLSAKASEVGGYLDIETDADDNDAAALFTEPLGTITRNSGKKFWFEARFEIGDITGDYGFFCGIVEEAGANLDVIADDAAALVGQSYICARVFTADPDGLDIAYKLDAGTEVVVLEDATNSAAITTGGGTVASLANDTEVKFGIRFDGRETLHFYIDGHKVATQDVDTTIDQTKNYCACVSLKTGAAAAESFATDWIRVAVQDKSG
jgi:hypothetical protein